MKHIDLLHRMAFLHDQAADLIPVDSEHHKHKADWYRFAAALEKSKREFQTEQAIPAQI